MTKHREHVVGRCYCGSVRFEADRSPLSVCVCHCTDCRRATGGPAIAVAAFDQARVRFSGNVARFSPHNSGVERTFCGTCGTSLAFMGDYVPGQVFVHLGIIDDADCFEPTVESYVRDRLPWMHVNADAQQFSRSSRAELNAARSPRNTVEIKADGALERCG